MLAPVLNDAVQPGTLPASRSPHQMLGLTSASAALKILHRHLRMENRLRGLDIQIWQRRPLFHPQRPNNPGPLLRLNRLVIANNT